MYILKQGSLFKELAHLCKTETKEINIYFFSNRKCKINFVLKYSFEFDDYFYDFRKYFESVFDKKFTDINEYEILKQKYDELEKVSFCIMIFFINQ